MGKESLSGWFGLDGCTSCNAYKELQSELQSELELERTINAQEELNTMNHIQEEQEAKRDQERRQQVYSSMEAENQRSHELKKLELQLEIEKLRAQNDTQNIENMQEMLNKLNKF